MRGVQYQRDSPGSFAIEQLGRHKYLLRVRDTRWSAKPLVVDTSSGSKNNVTIRCTPAASVVLHVDPEMVDEVDIVDAEQLQVAEETVRADGRVELHLIPGAYSATLKKAGQSVSTIRFQAGGQAQEIELRHP